MLSPLLSGSNPSVGVYHRADGVHARISAKAATREEAWRLIEPVDQEARRILGPSIWGQDDETLTSAVGRMLREAGQTLAVMESATGGAIGNAITDLEDASEYLLGSLVVHTAQGKIDLGVPAETVSMHGEISQQTAEAMAKVARERLGADIGLGIAGIVDNEGGRGPAAGDDAHRGRRRRWRRVLVLALLPGPGGGEAARWCSRRSRTCAAT